MEKAEDLKAKGVDTIACVSVNDAFVMDAWSKSVGTDGKILMLADGSANFTKVSKLICFAMWPEVTCMCKVPFWRHSVCCATAQPSPYMLALPDGQDEAPQTVLTCISTMTLA